MGRDRIESIRQLLVDEEVDALVLFGMPNIRYLTGFTGTDGVVLITPEKSLFLTDSRYLDQAKTQVSTDQIVCYKNKYPHLVEELINCSLENVGFDADMVNVAVYNDLCKLAAGRFSLHPISDKLRGLRSIKSTAELDCLRQAAQLNFEAFNEIVPLIKPGVTERKIALELEFSLKRCGGEANAFDFIVASGERGALPHGVASDKKLQAGELVTIDFGTRVSGYHSDETVTLAIGAVNGKLRQIYDIVLEAHDLALSAIKLGYMISDLDAVARDFIRAKGYAEYFAHGLGHGVGLEIHEFPAVSAKTDTPLQQNMVITIEPGIYLPGVGGVRIEDTVVVTENGYETLTQIPKQFKQLTIN